jgi:hypothetical protein
MNAYCNFVFYSDETREHQSDSVAQSLLHLKSIVSEEPDSTKYVDILDNAPCTPLISICMKFQVKTST